LDERGGEGGSTVTFHRGGGVQKHCGGKGGRGLIGNEKKKRKS